MAKETHKKAKCMAKEAYQRPHTCRRKETYFFMAKETCVYGKRGLSTPAYLQEEANQ